MGACSLFFSSQGSCSLLLGRDAGGFAGESLLEMGLFWRFWKASGPPVRS